MIKQILAIVALSVAIVFSMEYAQQGLQMLVNAHGWVAQVLKEIFSGGQYGNLVRGSLALLSIPVIVGLIPALVYWLMNRHWFPYFMHVVWAAWFIQAGALIVLYKA